MMAVVVDHADPGGLAPQLEAAVHAAEVFQRRADVVGLDVEPDSHRDRRGRVQNIVHSRHMQPEFAEVAFARRSHENG